jgi:hypothetical protein
VVLENSDVIQKEIPVVLFDDARGGMTAARQVPVVDQELCPFPEREGVVEMEPSDVPGLQCSE